MVELALPRAHASRNARLDKSEIRVLKQVLEAPALVEVRLEICGRIWVRLGRKARLKDASRRVLNRRIAKTTASSRRTPRRVSKTRKLKTRLGTIKVGLYGVHLELHAAACCRTIVKLP